MLDKKQDYTESKAIVNSITYCQHIVNIVNGFEAQMLDVVI